MFAGHGDVGDNREGYLVLQDGRFTRTDLYEELHRIGQARPVLATRLIARDTVEERVLDLQRSKRDLAGAIITADNSLIARIERDELELLLG